MKRLMIVSVLVFNSMFMTGVYAQSTCKSQCDANHSNEIAKAACIVSCGPGDGAKLPVRAEQIQGCTVSGIVDLGYTSGSKHQFCLDKGWKGGEIANTCWKVTDGETTAASAAAACSRIQHYYSSPNCKHLATDDVKKLKSVGGKLKCSG